MGKTFVDEGADLADRPVPSSRAGAVVTIQGDEPGGPTCTPVPSLGSVAALVAAAAATASCGGGGADPAVAAPPPPSSTALDPADMAAVRLLLHAQIAATDADIAAVRAQGAGAWLDAQFAMPLGETLWQWFDSRGYLAIDENQYYDNDYPLNYGIAYQLIKSADGVRKRVALALSEQFVVAAPGLMMMAWRYLGAGHYWDQLNQHAFGNFRQLLEAVTLNPAMGLFLNTRGNAKEDPATGRVPDENYAREVMQLFTIGLVQLNLDGTPVVDASGKPVPTYSQDDVTQLARVFTGYGWWDDGQTFPAAVGGHPRPYPEFTRRPMVLDPALHSALPVAFLGSSIPANTAAATALGTALDTLFNHANAGPFFARQMIQRLVTSNPSPAYVARVAAKFNDNGAGVRGDLKAVWKAILLDDQAVGSAGLTSTTFGKLREPMIRMYQWARTFGVESKLGRWKWGLDYGNPTYWYGQRPFFSPSVFNFFRPGYVPPGTALSAVGATAPEFQITNESTVSQWVNAIEVIAFYGIYVTLPDKPGLPAPYAGPYPSDGFDISTDYAAELTLAPDAEALVRRLNLLLCAGQLSGDTQARIVSIITDSISVAAASSAEVKRARVATAVILVMCCPEYIVQK